MFSLKPYKGALFLLTCFLSLTLISSWLDKAERNLLGVKKGVTIENIKLEGFLRGEVLEVVEELARKHQKLPVEPGLDKLTGKIIPGQQGLKVDIDGTINATFSASENQAIPLIVLQMNPRYSAQDLERVTQKIGYYATGFHGSAARYQNITVAIRSINNTVLWPGDVFSFNEVTGPRTAERGYLPAPVIMSGGFNLDYGGGVCQVSSTLYNAILKADLPVIERHSHSKPIHYVPPGRDATVNYGYLDLRFLNSRSGAVIIKAAVSGGRIAVEIWGGES